MAADKRVVPGEAEALAMSIAPPEEWLTRSWEELLRKSYKPRINDVAIAYPEQRSLLVDWWDVDRHSQDLAEYLLRKPTNVLFCAEKAVRAVDTPLPETPRLHIRVRNLPALAQVGIRKRRGEHTGRLIAVDGLVTRVTDPAPRIEDALFTCNGCHALVQEAQDEHRLLKEPLQCYEDQGGCGKSIGFKLRTEKSTFVDVQTLEIQEAPETLRGGEQPRRLTLEADDDLVDTVRIGDRIVANGILRTVPKRKAGKKDTHFQQHLQVVSIERREQGFQDVEVTKEDEAKVLALAKAPDVLQQLTRSIAPSIIGLETEKEILTLQLFGGVEKFLPDRRRVRGEIHVLMVGDPGTAKSELGRRCADVHPRSIYTSGKQSSGAGLTAAAVQDEDGRWTISAGALVIADQGLAVIDEIDKMEPKDRGSLHEALQHGTVSVAKADARVRFPARASVLAMANPRDGRFDPTYDTIAEQIDLGGKERHDLPLIGRFDAILVLFDKPSLDADREYGAQILRAHSAAAMRAYRGVHGNQGLYTPEAEEAIATETKPPVAEDLLRKYVAYAQRHAIPVLDEAAQARINEHWAGLRNTPAARGLPMGRRQHESLARLAEASARAHLRSVATVEDANRAIRLLEYTLKRVANDGKGGFDIDKIESGIGQRDRGRIHLLIGLVDEYAQRDERNGASLDDLARGASLSLKSAEELLERLAEDGRLVRPRGPNGGWYKPIGRRGA